MAATVISYAELSRSGCLDRVKVCANPDCSYMFYDETRNRSRRFCDAALCGTLSRVRRYRGMTRAADVPTE
jgi:predicted RNA-binding Zn ribbon-like protein